MIKSLIIDLHMSHVHENPCRLFVSDAHLNCKCQLHCVCPKYMPTPTHSSCCMQTEAKDKGCNAVTTSHSAERADDCCIACHGSPGSCCHSISICHGWPAMSRQHRVRSYHAMLEQHSHLAAEFSCSRSMCTRLHSHPQSSYKLCACKCGAGPP